MVQDLLCFYRHLGENLVKFSTRLLTACDAQEKVVGGLK